MQMVYTFLKGQQLRWQRQNPLQTMEIKGGNLLDLISVKDHPNKDVYIENNGKKIKAWNGYYKCYTAAYCKLTGLPMMDKYDYGPCADKWLSPSRCKKAGKPVQQNEKPVAFYRVMNGFCPLYERSEESEGGNY